MTCSCVCLTTIRLLFWVLCQHPAVVLFCQCFIFVVVVYPPRSTVLEASVTVCRQAIWARRATSRARLPFQLDQLGQELICNQLKRPSANKATGFMQQLDELGRPQQADCKSTFQKTKERAGRVHRGVCVWGGSAGSKVLM